MTQSWIFNMANSVVQCIFFRCDKRFVHDDTLLKLCHILSYVLTARDYSVMVYSCAVQIRTICGYNSLHLSRDFLELTGSIGQAWFMFIFDVAEIFSQQTIPYRWNICIIHECILIIRHFYEIMIISIVQLSRLVLQFSAPLSRVPLYLRNLIATHVTAWHVAARRR